MTLQEIDHAVSNILKSLPPKPPHMSTAEYEHKHALRRVAALEAVEKLRQSGFTRLEALVGELRETISQLTIERDNAIKRQAELQDQLKSERQRADAALTLANAVGGARGQN